MRSILIGLLLIGTTAFAKENCDLAHPSGFRQTVEGKRSFGETEIRARNHDIGLYRGGPMTLAPWIDTGENSAVGINQNGDVVQILWFTDKRGVKRQVATMLSHGKKFKTVFMTNEGELYAFSKDDSKLHVFSWEKWSTSEGVTAIAATKRRLSASVCGLNAVMLVATAMQALTTGEMPFHFLVGGLVGSIALAGTHAAAIGHHYQVANEETNGFIETNVFLTSPIKSTQYLWTDDHLGIRDFEIRLEDGQTALLSEGLTQLNSEFQLAPPAEGVAAFALKCEHLLLARGIPSSAYEPDWSSR